MIEALRSEWETQQAQQQLAAGLMELAAGFAAPAGPRQSDEMQARAAMIHARAMGR